MEAQLPVADTAQRLHDTPPPRSDSLVTSSIMSTDDALRQEVARQIMPSSADGGIIAQLSNNPFFAAVLPLVSLAWARC